MITVHQLYFEPILSGIDFMLPRGRSLAIIGHNGAGKTTLFHVLLGLKLKTSGEVELRTHQKGFVSERPYLDMEESFGGFLDLHLGLIGIPKSKRESEMNRVATKVGLQDQRNKKFKQFSKGMLQKAVLAQALLGSPDLLILDEPMSGLDPQSRMELGELLRSLRKDGVTLVFSSHAMEDVESLADQVLVLNHGKQSFFGDCSEWKKKMGGGV